MKQDSESRKKITLIVSLCFDKGAKNIHWGGSGGGEKAVCSTNVQEQLNIHMQKDELITILHSTHKINSKWITDLSYITETMKYEEKIGENC
jgi:hypothetical protein